MSSKLTLRPHHLMCIHGFRGRGYSPEFVRNFWATIKALQGENSRVVPLIKIASGVDTICEPCPHNQAGICSEEAGRISKLDAAYAETLGVSPGQELTWKEATKLVALKVSDSDFERNCAPCSWRRLGFCLSALQVLRGGKGTLSSVVVALFTTLGFALAGSVVGVPGGSYAWAQEEVLVDLTPAAPPEGVVPSTIEGEKPLAVEPAEKAEAPVKPEAPVEQASLPTDSPAPVDAETVTLEDEEPIPGPDAPANYRPKKKNSKRSGRAAVKPTVRPTPQRIVRQLSKSGGTPRPTTKAAANKTKAREAAQKLAAATPASSPLATPLAVAEPSATPKPLTEAPDQLTMQPSPEPSASPKAETADASPSPDASPEAAVATVESTPSPEERPLNTEAVSVPPVIPPMDPNFASIHTIEGRILADKTKRIAEFSLITKALNAKQWAVALKHAKKLQKNPDFRDYFHFLTAQAHFGRMRDQIDSGQWANAMFSGDQAVYHFVQAQGENPAPALAKRAILFQGETEVALGECYVKRKRLPKAREHFERGFQRLSANRYLGFIPKQSIISYAMLCEKKRTDLCRNWVSRLSPLMAKQERRLLERVGLPKAPYIPKASSAPTTYRVDLDLQTFQKGFADFLAENYEEAYITWSQLLRDYPRTNIKLRTKFWMARAAHKSEHPAHAETLYREIIREAPFSYFALLSSWYGNIDLARMMDAEFPIASINSEYLGPSEMLRIRRAEILLASGVQDLALLELQDVRPNLNMTNEFLVYLAALNHLAGHHQATFQIFGELTSRNFTGLYSGYGQKLLFPTSHLNTVNQIAREWRVDPLLVLSVIKQESAFNPGAVSGANAYGLMQIISPTARDLDPKVNIIDLLTPAKNVQLGAKYIAQLLTKYKGQLIPALAAYNAGPTNSDRWIRDLSHLQAPEEFIEQIGFKETREYVQNVIRNYYWYNRTVKREIFPHIRALLQTIATQGDWSRPMSRTPVTPEPTSQVTPVKASKGAVASSERKIRQKAPTRNLIEMPRRRRSFRQGR